MFLKKILKPYSLEELLKKSWTIKAVFFSENFTNIFNLYQLKYRQQRLRLDKKVGNESRNSNFIKWRKKADWDYAIALNQLNVHFPLQIFWQIGIDFLAKLINEFILLTWHKNIPLGVETNVVVNYIHILRESFQKSVVVIIICDNYHNYLDSVSKLKARYCLDYQAKSSIFYFGSVTKFISKFLPLKIPELPDSIVYKINIAVEKVSIKCMPSSLGENIFKKETFIINDVIKLLPGLRWGIYIFPLLSCLVSKAAVSF